MRAGMGGRGFLGILDVFQIVLLTVLLVGCDLRPQQAEQKPDNTELVQQSFQSSDVTAGSVEQAASLDAHPGKLLHDANCISCHDTGKYQSAARQISGFPALLKQVRGCNANLNPGLKDNEIRQVADYLNQAFYSTTGTKESEL